MPKKIHEEHANHEAWAIPYGDLITLLLAFFVVMYSLSSVNEGKYRVLSDALQAAFRGDTRTLEPIQIGEVRKGAEPREEPTMVSLSLAPPPPSGVTETERGGTDLSGRTFSDRSMPSSGTAEKMLDDIAAQMEKALGKSLPAEWVVIRRTRQWIEIEIRTDLLFASGSSALDERALPVIDQIGNILRPFPNPVHVEGHTDTMPINMPQFPSNWELSAARAATVVRRFVSSGIDPSRMTVVGLGEQRPVAPNDTPEGRDRNRRVVLLVLDPVVAQNPDAATQPSLPGASAG